MEKKSTKKTVHHKDSNKNAGIVWMSAIIVVLLLAIAFVVYYYFLPNDINQERKTRQAELDGLYASEALPVAPEGVDAFNYGLGAGSTSTVEDLAGGYLVFSGLLLGGSQSTQVYTLDLSTTTAQAQRLLPEKYTINGFAEFMDKTEAGNFFVNTLDNVRSATSTDNDGTRIQRYNVADNTLESFESVSGFYEQDIAWSEEAGLLAYKRLAVPFRSYTDLVPIQNWEVVISDIEKDEVVTVIPGASQPKWSPDGSKLLVLMADGLYAYDVEAATSNRVVEAGSGQILATSMIDLSPDGKYIVWTTPKVGVISVHEITSWEPFELSEIGRIHEGAEYYWPQFSPDSEYYIVQAIDPAAGEGQDRTNPRYEIRSILNRTVIRTIPITDFDFNAYFTDTWIEEVPTITEEEAAE